MCLCEPFLIIAHDFNFVLMIVEGGDFRKLCPVGLNCEVYEGNNLKANHKIVARPKNYLKKLRHDVIYIQPLPDVSITFSFKVI